MAKIIQLSEPEATLRLLLLDVCEYIGTLDGYSKPHLRFTGGWVRDKLLGTASNDIDIGIDTMTGLSFGMRMKEYLELPEAKAKHPQSALAKLAKIEANPEKSKHLETVATKILGFDIDLVNLRKETYSEDSRNPQIEFGNPVEDALRRDATVNALFYNLEKCEVEDLTDRGLNDIRDKIIRTPLCPYQTFKDDPLRVLRAIRFASRLGWSIDKKAEQAMSAYDIGNALKTKISRERVCIELIKMLKGPRPYQAFGLIDRLDLYHTIFTMFSEESTHAVKTKHWKKSYGQLRAIVSAVTGDPSQSPEPSNKLMNISSTLLSNPIDAPNDVYHAWLLCAFVPWARVSPAVPQKSKGKAPPRPAALVARDGLKADNHTVKLIDNAIRDLNDIIHIKDAANVADPPVTSPLGPGQESPIRSKQGMAIRRWGPYWRSSVMFALLTQVAENSDDNDEELLEGYAQWLKQLRHLDLLEVYRIEPMVTSQHLLENIHPNPGAWMSKALDMGIAWQLAHPGSMDIEAALLEIKSKKNELGPMTLKRKGIQ
ncbi:MAG: hypothetical protein L6R35_001043 [Caloplaca aegaea]|nr:MAG: hypothetical protein L6R35_001043 [Caloplaca aegaea]